MTTIKSYTDISQSRKLAEILPIESADMWYWEFPTAPTYNGYGYPMFHKGEDIRNVPCWSLTALMDVLDRGALFKTPKGWACQAYIGSKAITSNYHSNPIDACYEMIIKLHEQNLL